jgi:hypothetical protein
MFVLFWTRAESVESTQRMDPVEVVWEVVLERDSTRESRYWRVDAATVERVDRLFDVNRYVFWLLGCPETKRSTDVVSWPYACWIQWSLKFGLRVEKL